MFFSMLIFRIDSHIYQAPKARIASKLKMETFLSRKRQKELTERVAAKNPKNSWPTKNLKVWGSNATQM